MINLGFAAFMGDMPLNPKKYWQYLGFFFDRMLTFGEHTRCYANKALTLARAMLSLGNSAKGLTPHHKHLLVRLCVIPIMTYGAQL